MSKQSHLKEHLEESPVLRHHPTFHGMTISEELECLLAVVMIVFGFACLLCTDQMHELLPYVFATPLCLLGVLYLVHAIQNKEYLHTETSHTAQGIVYLLLGIVLFVRSHDAVILIGAIWGMLGLYKGTEKLNDVFADLAAHKPCLLKAAHAALELFLGVTVLLDPVNNLHHHIIILGLELMLIALQILLAAYLHEEFPDSLPDVARGGNS